MIYFELFYVFFLIGLFTFGGGYAMIPMIQTEVTNRGWLEPGVLTDFIAISEATPGPFAINIATFIGSTQGGILGSVCATIGVVLPSFIIILIVAIIVDKFIKNPYVKGALNGVKPVVLALIAATAVLFFIKMALFNGGELYSQAINFDRKSVTLLILVGGFVFLYKKINKKSLSPISLLLLCGALGIILFI